MIDKGAQFYKLAKSQRILEPCQNTWSVQIKIH